MPTQDLDIVDDATRREFLVGLAVAGLLVACGGDDDGADAAEEPTTRTFVDVTGEEVEVPDRATRIVATNDQNAGAQLLALGAPVVGIASRDGVLDPSIAAFFDADELTLVGEHFEPNVEAIAALRPDLIVHEGYEGAITIEDGVLARLREIAPVVGIDPFRPVEEVMADYAELLGGGAVALVDQQAAEFEERLAELEAVLGDRWGDTTASLIVTNGDALEAWAPDTLDAIDIVRRVGAQSPPLMLEAALPENGGYISDISLERLPELSADLIFVDTAFAGAAILEHPLFVGLPAALQGQVIEIDSTMAGGHFPAYTAMAQKIIDQVGAMEPFRTDLV